MSRSAPVAVSRARAGAAAWAEAASRVQRGQLDHADFHALGADLVGTLRSLADLTAVLAGEVEKYGRRVGDRLYDDTGRVDPHARLAEAAAHLRAVHAVVQGHGRREADKFWSAVGHIGRRLDEDGR